MSKKLKIIIAVVAGIAVLAAGGVSLVMAADNGSGTTPPATKQDNPLLSSVASILGVTEQDLSDAMKTAGKQLQSQRIDQLLAQAVTNNKITQAEADAIKAWLADRPANPTKDELKAWENNRPQLSDPSVLKGLLGFAGKISGLRGLPYNNTDFLNAVVVALNTATGKNFTVQQLQDALVQAQGQIKTSQLDKALANAVTNGKLTQAEADAIKAWWDQRPSALDRVMPNIGFGLPGPGNGGVMRGFRGIRPGRGPFPFMNGSNAPATQPTT